MIRALALSALAFAAAPALAAPAQLPGDMAMGNPKAKVEVIEYASLACPHCAHFNEAVFAGLKTKWIDTGQVHYVMKEMVTEPTVVAIAGARVARCAGPDKYFKVVDEVFRSQPRWTAGQIKPILQQIAADNGLDEAAFNACLSDEAAAQAVVERAVRAQEQDGVSSTPTVFVNGRKLDPTPLTAADMDAAIAAAMKAPAAAKAPAAKKGGR